MVRRVNKGLIAVLIFVLGAWSGVALTEHRVASAIASTQEMSMASIDWAHSSSVDLTLAGVFLTARDRGIGAALDSLGALAERDSGIRTMSPTMLHHVAHSLGQFAVEHSDFDPHVMADCRVGYAAGCYHGVMEGYFSAHPALDSASLANLCDSIAPRSPALAVRECAHGMGHGLMGLAGYTIDRALTSCGYLTVAALQRECYDGVFMTTVSSPGAGEMTGMAGMSMSPGDSHAATGAGSGAGCEHLEARYLGACWAYRPLALIATDGGDLSRVIHDCDAVPSQARADCYYGVGKQGSGMFVSDPARVAKACRSGSPHYSKDCRAGAVAYYTDITWNAERAVEFCSSLPNGEKTDCYQAIGADMSLMQPDSSSLDRECKRSEARFVEACREAARLAS